MMNDDTTLREKRFRNEDAFQHTVEDLADQYGWKAQHFQRKDYQAGIEAGKRMPRGIPDLVLSKKIEGQDQPIIMFAELKTDTTDLDTAQAAFLKFFSPTIVCFEWRPKNLSWIKSILKYGPPEPTGFIIEESNSPLIGTKALEDDRSTQARISRIVGEIGSPNFARSDLAGLRRMNPDTSKPTAFLQVMAKVGYPQDPHGELKWALILHGIALMTPNAHDQTVPVGRALFLGGENYRPAERGFYSRSRLNKLLNARGTIRRSLLARLFRMLRSVNQPLDWYEMADFILSEGYDEEAAKQSRLSIAKKYYQAEVQGI